MISTVIVGITMGLIVIASALYRGGRRRVYLLRTACVGLFVATLCRGVEPSFDTPGIDLVKRWAILTSQAAVVLLILSFRSGPGARRATKGVHIATALVALGEGVLVGFLPVHADGTVFHQVEIHEAAARGQAWALVSYHALYLSAFAVATAIVAVGCCFTLAQRNQPFAARLPVLFVLAGALGSALFIGSSLMDLFGHPVFGGSENRKFLLIAVVGSFFIGLGLGVARGVGIGVRKAIALRLAREVVLPLWRTTTALHPDVRLPPEDRAEFDQVMNMSRLTIETHDALRLIRDDDDPALRQLHRLHPQDPQLSAGLVRHLGGEDAVPPLGRFAFALTRVRAFHLSDDAVLASSLTSLYHIRLAMAAMSTAQET